MTCTRHQRRFITATSFQVGDDMLHIKKLIQIFTHEDILSRRQAYHMSAALPSYVRSNSTSGAMYSGVPQVDLDTDWPASSLENPVSVPEED